MALVQLSANRADIDVRVSAKVQRLPMFCTRVHMFRCMEFVGSTQLALQLVNTFSFSSRAVNMILQF